MASRSRLRTLLLASRGWSRPTTKAFTPRRTCSRARMRSKFSAKGFKVEKRNGIELTVGAVGCLGLVDEGRGTPSNRSWFKAKCQPCSSRLPTLVLWSTQPRFGNFRSTAGVGLTWLSFSPV